MNEKIVYTENLNSRLCAHCQNRVIPVRNSEPPHLIHGYKFFCPECKKFMAWGGREKAIIDTNGKRQTSTNWTAKKLGIDICEICGATLEMAKERGENLEAHHKQPISEGGKDEPDNILIVCTDCHKMIHHKRTYGEHNLKFYVSHKLLQALRKSHPELYEDLDRGIS